MSQDRRTEESGTPAHKFYQPHMHKYHAEAQDTQARTPDCTNPHTYQTDTRLCMCDLCSTRRIAEKLGIV